MRIKRVLNIFLIVCFYVGTLQAKEKKEITLYGKVDPRLYVTLWSTYRSMHPDDVRMNYEECSQYNWNTGHRGRTLDFVIVDVVPNKAGEYNATIPIDYPKNNGCGYEYVDTQFKIKRDKKDEKYAKITVAGSENITHNIYRGVADGYSTLGKKIKGVRTEKNHYQISSGSKIECYTKYYIYGERFQHRRSTQFACEPVVAHDINGVDELKSTRLKLDILVNEDKSIVYPVNSDSVGPKPYGFKDYEPPLSLWEKIQKYLNNLINNEEKK